MSFETHEMSVQYGAYMNTFSWCTHALDMRIRYHFLANLHITETR